MSLDQHSVQYTLLKPKESIQSRQDKQGSLSLSFGQVVAVKLQKGDDGNDNRCCLIIPLKNVRKTRLARLEKKSSFHFRDNKRHRKYNRQTDQDKINCMHE